MKKNNESILKKITPYAGKKKILLYISMIFSASSGVLLLIPMIYIYRIFNHIITNQVINIDFITKNAIYSVLFALIGIILYILATFCSHVFAFEVEENIIKINFNKLINKPLGYFLNKESGSIRTVISDGAAQTHTFLAHQLPDLAITIITPVILLVLFFVIDWRFGVISLIPVIIGIFLMGSIMTKKIKKLRDDYFDNLAKLSSETVEYVRGIPVVKTFNIEIKSFNKLYDLIQKIKKLSLDMTLGYRNKYTAFEVILGATALFLIPAAILMIENGYLTNTVISNFFLYILIAPMFSIFLLRTATISQNGHIAKVALDNIDNLLKYENLEFGESDNDDSSIEFSDVSFSYKDDKVIKNISFKINNGEKVALVGPSGSGKSTIAKLVARFFDPQDGEILIGGINVKQYSKEKLMNKLSFIFQNSKLFKMSLKDNLLIGKVDATDEELDEVLKKVGLKNLVDELPNGLNTIYGSKGVFLSGGEAQRFILARALLKKSQILIFDEATAFIDPENENLIYNTFESLSKNKTTLLIAHRLSSVIDADKIILIDDGRIVEQGSHKELLNKKGLYNKLWTEYEKSIEWNVGEKNDN